MRPAENWDRLIGGLRSGDDHVIAEFSRQYGPGLERLADRHISPAMRRRFGPESVALSACGSFLRRARAGQFDLADSEDLWRLLCAITLTKVRERTRFHRREKRSVEREVAAMSDDGEARLEAVDPAPRPDDLVAIAEEFERLLDSLDDEERSIVQLKLQDLPNLEIADRLGCSQRTVVRLVGRVRQRLESCFD